MAETYYAWSPIKYDVEVEEKTGQVLRDVVHPAGEKVTAQKLGVSDEEFKSLVDSGAVRTYPMPELPEGFTGSVRDFLFQKHKMAEGNLPGGYEDYDLAAHLEERAKLQETAQEPTGAEGKVTNTTSGEARPAGTTS